MLIESRIKPHPKPTRTITLFGTRYEFRALLPNRFVAEVTDEAHIKTFLGNPAYAEFKDNLPAPTLQRSPVPVIGGEPPQGVPVATVTTPVKDPLPEGDESEGNEESEEDGDDVGADVVAASGSWPTAVADEAAALLRNSAAKLPVAVAKVSSIDVIRCAVALEQNRTGKQQPRAAVIELLEGTLRDIATAGA